MVAIEIENGTRTGDPNTCPNRTHIGLAGMYPNKGGLSKRPHVLVPEDLGDREVRFEACDRVNGGRPVFASLGAGAFRPAARAASHAHGGRPVFSGPGALRSPHRNPTASAVTLRLGAKETRWPRSTTTQTFSWAGRLSSSTGCKSSSLAMATWRMPSSS